MKRFIRVYGSGSGSVRHPGLKSTVFFFFFSATVLPLLWLKKVGLHLFEKFLKGKSLFSENLNYLILETERSSNLNLVKLAFRSVKVF